MTALGRVTLAALVLFGSRAAAAQTGASRVAADTVAADTTRPQSAELVHRVVDVTDGGRYVVLDDGSTWEVYAPNRPTTDDWPANSTVVVRESGLSVGPFNFVMANGTEETELGRKEVWVRFAGMR